MTLPLTVAAVVKLVTPRLILVVTTILSSWLLMQIVHELGHVASAITTRAVVRKVVLVPWEISRTEIRENPSPLLVCWAGPIVGVLIPLIVWIVARWRCWKVAYWFRFLSGFCLIANGAYLFVGAFTHDGDAGDLLRDGAPIWTLWLFGAATVPIGFLIWHGSGRSFGFGPNAIAVSWRVAFVSVLVLAVICILEIACGAFCNVM